MTERGSALLQEQIEYYSARAPECDEWFLRQGRYDRGQDQRQRGRAGGEAAVGRLGRYRAHDR
ncbi:MAG: hypothetical protein O7A98_02605 [Acidobacteria bacterium]|nr:hypothetical protein [Acidobacteriota bacterium]